MSVPGSLIRPVDSVRDLGILIDSGLNLFDRVNKVAALCYFHIRQLPCTIHNRMDYCNAILAFSPKYLTEKLQSVLRVATRLVLRLPSRSPVSASMRDQLHWLSGSRSGSGVPVCLLCSSVALARSLASLIC